MADNTDSRPPPAAPSKWRGWVILTSSIVLPLILAVSTAWVLWTNRLPVAQWALSVGVERAGIADVTARVERVEADGIRISEFRLGDAITADAFEVTYTPKTLSEGRVISVAISGLQVSATVDEGGISITGLETERSAEEAAPPRLPALPFDELRIENTVLQVDTQSGPVRVPVTLTMSIEPTGEMIFNLTAEPEHEMGAVRANVTGAIVMDVSGAAELAAQFGAAGTVRFADKEGAVPFDLRGEATLNFDQSLSLQHIDIPSIFATIEPISFAGMYWEFDRLAARVSGAPDAFRGAVGVAGALSGEPAAGITVANLIFDAESEVAYSDGTVTLSPRAGGGAEAHGVIVGDRLRMEGPTHVLFAETAGSVTYDTRSGATDYEFRLAPIETTATLQNPDTGDVTATFRLPNVGVSGTKEMHSLRLRNATLEVQEPPVMAQGVDIDVSINPDTMSVDGAIARLQHEADPPLAQPVALSFGATLANGIIDFAADATLPPSPLKLSARGRHDMAAGQGNAEYALDRIEFVPGVVDAAALFPALADNLREVEGALSANGTANWDNTGRNTSLDLDLNALALGFPAGRVSGLTGTLAIEGPFPITTPPGQRLSGALTAGPLQAAPFEVAFHLRPDNRLALEELTLDFADGRIAMRDVTYDPANPDLEAALSVDTIDLAGLLELIKVEGLNGSGRLSGRIPLAIDGGKVVVRQGRLEAEGPGRLSYTGAALTDQLGDRGDAVGLTMQALSDFRYDSLSLELEKTAAGTGNILLRMAGANPAVLEGYPFAININLEGDFDRIAALALEGYATLDDILRWAGGVAPN